MNYKKQILSILGVSVFVGGGVWCFESNFSAMIQFFEKLQFGDFYLKVATLIFGSLFFFSIAIFLVSITLFFIKEVVYLAWRKFAIWYVPISIIYISTASSRSQGSFGYSLPSDQEFAIYALPFLFIVISLILIIYKSIKLRGKS
jgi:uncharacterized membrane protein YhdT